MVSVNQTKKSYDIMNITAWEANHFFLNFLWRWSLALEEIIVFIENSIITLFAVDLNWEFW